MPQMTASTSTRPDTRLDWTSLGQRVEGDSSVSYLEHPRMHFIGCFQVDVSTVNNDPLHFDDNRFLPRYQLPSDSTGLNGWWNPSGTGIFRIQNCTIKRLVTDHGILAADPLLKGFVSDAHTGVSAKIVDLDPQQQGVSQIW
jgi:hypothetical protein